VLGGHCVVRGEDTAVMSLDGLMVADHRVPDACILVFAVICERCGFQMFVPYGTRWCAECEPLVNLEDFGYSLESALRRALDDAGIDQG